MWNGNEEEVVLNSNSDSDGRGQDLTLGVGAGKKGLKPGASSAPRRDSAEPRPRGCSGLGEPRPALPSF